jgi:hypothetical protein
MSSLPTNLTLASLCTQNNDNSRNNFEKLLLVFMITLKICTDYWLHLEEVAELAALEVQTKPPNPSSKDEMGLLSSKSLRVQHKRVSVRGPPVCKVLQLPFAQKLGISCQKPDLSDG